MAKIDRFIEKYPDELASEFRRILRAFYAKGVTRQKVKQLMAQKIDTALNTIRPVKRRKS